MAGDMLPPVVAILDADISKYTAKLGKAKGDMEETAKSGGGHFSSLATGTGVAMVAAGVAVIGFAKSSLSAFEGVAGETAKMERITGESAETMSRLRFAGEETGVSAETLSKNFVRLAKDVGTGNKALAQNHIATKDAKGNALGMNDVLMNTAEVFKKMPDGIDKTTLATKLFGKSGVEMLPFLNKGKDGLAELTKESDKFGLTIGQSGVDAMKKNVLAHRQMHAAWQGLQVQLGAHLMPIVATVTSWLAQEMPKAIEFLRKVVEKLTPAFQLVGHVLQAVVGWIQEFIGGFTKGTDALGSSQSKLAQWGAVAYEIFLRVESIFKGMLKFYTSVVKAFQNGGISAAWATIVAKLREVLPKIAVFFAQMAQKWWEWVKKVYPPLLRELLKLLQQLGTWLRGTALPWLSVHLQEWGKAFWAWVKVAVPPAIRELGRLLEALGAWIWGVALPAIGAKLAEWGKAFWAWIQPMISPFLGELVHLLAILGNWLLGTALPFIGSKLAQWADAFWQWIQPMIVPFLGELVHLLAALGNWLLGTALPFIGNQLAQWAAAFWAWISPMIVPFLAELGNLLLALGDWLLTTALPAILEKLGQWALAFVQWVGPQIPPLLAELGSLLLALGDWLLTTALPAILTKLGEWALAFVKWVGPQIPPLLVELGTLLVKLGDWLLTTALPAIVSKLLEWGKAFFGWVAQAILDLLAKLGDLSVAVLGWIGDRVIDIGVKIAGWGEAFFSWVAGTIADVPNRLGGLLDAFLGWVGDLGSNIASGFAKIPGALWAAFKSAWNSVADFTSFTIGGGSFMGVSLPSLSVHLLPHLAKGGLVTQSGLAVVGEDGAEVVELPQGAKVNPHGTGPGSNGTDGGGNSGGGTNITNITNHIHMAPGADGNEIIRTIKKWEQRNGPGWRAA